MLRASLALTALVFALTASRAAHADDYINGMIFGGAVGMPLAAAGVAGALTVALSKGDGGRPSGGAKIFGFISGLANLGWGVAMMAGGAKARDNSGLFFGFGAINAAVGATGLGISAYRWNRPPAAVVQSGGVSLVPVTGVDAAGRAFAGLGLRLFER